MKTINILLIFLMITCYGGVSFAQVYTVPILPWSESFGNHRAVIQVDKPGDAAMIDFLWRRHDLHPENKRFIVIDSATGDTVRNIYRKGSEQRTV